MTSTIPIAKATKPSAGMPMPSGMRLLRPSIVLAAVLFQAAPGWAIYKCAGEGDEAVRYTDQPCGGGPQQVLDPVPLPLVPALRPGPSSPASALPSGKPERDTAAARPPRGSRRQPTPADTAAGKKCGKLLLRRQWANEDVRQALAQPLQAQDKRLENAQRKARRADEQYRLECAAPS